VKLGLEGRRGLVTGGSKGLGEAIARELVSEGARVAICSRNEAEVSATAQEIGAEYAQAADVTDPEQVRDLVARTAEALGGIDFLVNNAGGAHPGTFATLSDEWLDEAASDGASGEASMSWICSAAARICTTNPSRNRFANRNTGMVAVSPKRTRIRQTATSPPNTDPIADRSTNRPPNVAPSVIPSPNTASIHGTAVCESPPTSVVSGAT